MRSRAPRLDLTNSHSLTDFQRNARNFIEGINRTRKPALLTVNGRVEAVLLDPVTFQELQEQAERDLFLDVLREGLRDVDDGLTKPAEQVVAEIRSKYGL